MVEQQSKINLIGIATFLFMLFFSSFTHANDFSASVDRTIINIGDQFYLTLSYNDKMDFDSPDLSALEEDFVVLSQSRQISAKYINGKGEVITNWKILLSPKKAGNLRIAPIKFKGQQTQPISIRVQTTKPSISNSGKDKFFDISLDKDSAYVQEQIIYRERFYIQNNFKGAQITDFKVPNANVIALGEPSVSQTQLNGRSYNLIERVFAIFPQKAGELIIPAQQVSAKMLTRANAIFGTPFSVNSQSRRIQIKAIPKSFPNSPWMIASKVTLSESFSQKDENWKVGDAVTRNIKLNASGVNASQLAALPMQDIQNLKYYPDELKSDNKTTANGIEGALFQSMALVATKAGTMTLPAIKVPFWNSQTNQLDYANLPARTIKVKALASALINKPADSKKESSINTAENSVQSHPSSGLWTLVFLLLLCSNTVFAFLWWKEKNKPNTADKLEQEHSSQSYKQAIKTLKTACMNNQPNDIRGALIQWGKLYLANTIHKPILSLADISQAIEEANLKLAIEELNAVLYSNQENSAFNGQGIWQAVKNLTQPKPIQTGATLPELEIK